MDCYFTGHCQPRPQFCIRQCPEPPTTTICSRPCPPASDHLRPPAGVASNRDYDCNWQPEPCCDNQRHARNHCLGQLVMEYSEPPCYPIAKCDDPLRFSRHALYDRRASDCEPTSRTLGKSHQVGYQPMQMLYVEDYDPCPNKKGPDCDCFNPDGTWRDKSKAQKRLEPTLTSAKSVPLQVTVPVAYDPCPNKKGSDCDCFNPDGTWRDKSKSVPVKLPRLDPCVTTTRKCEDNCPECPIEIHSRTVYPKCEPMLPGYGGHVPGVQICKFGKTYGRETREALQKVYSTVQFGRSSKKC